MNLGLKPIQFATDVLYPSGWTRIDDPNKIYTVKYKDTVNVPIIISPTKLVNGNTEIIVNTFLIGKDQQQLANNFFSLKTKKKVSWILSLNNKHDIYFKNDEKSKRLDFTVTNTGNYKQDLFINYSIPNIEKDLGKWIRNTIATHYDNGFSKAKLSVQNVIDAYKLIHEEDESPYYVKPGNDTTLFNVYNAFTELISNDNDKDIFNKCEKTLLLRSILDF